MLKKINENIHLKSTGEYEKIRRNKIGKWKELKAKKYESSFWN